MSTINSNTVSCIINVLSHVPILSATPTLTLLQEPMWKDDLVTARYLNVPGSGYGYPQPSFPEVSYQRPLQQQPPFGMGPWMAPGDYRGEGGPQPQLQPQGVQGQNGVGPNVPFQAKVSVW